MKPSKFRLRAFILSALTIGCLLAQQRPTSADQAQARKARRSGQNESAPSSRQKDAKRALAFYHDTLGLRLVREEPIALVFDANGEMLRIQIVGNPSVATYTVLGWNVPDIVATVTRLQRAGITQDELGIWKAGDGTRVAWFKDPDGHTLGTAQF